jgi:hypothetical protein
VAREVEQLDVEAPPVQVLVGKEQARRTFMAAAALILF